MLRPIITISRCKLSKAVVTAIPVRNFADGPTIFEERSRPLTDHLNPAWQIRLFFICMGILESPTRWYSRKMIISIFLLKYRELQVRISPRRFQGGLRTRSREHPCCFWGIGLPIWNFEFCFALLAP